MADKKALLIGNGDYEDENIPKLTKPASNIDGLAAVLTNPKIGSFAKENVKTMVNHPYITIRKAIARFFADSERDDLLLFYFSGHGFKDKSGDLYFAIQDTEKDLLSASAISASYFVGEISKSRSKQQVIILDCCFSGAFPQSDEGAPGATVIVLTASDTTEFAWENDFESEFSVFTHHLINGLKTGDADKDDDGFVSVTELYEYLKEKLKDSKQNPLKLHPFSREDGKIIIAANPRPSPLCVPQNLLDGHYFISYSPIDGEEFALRLYESLKAAKIPVWLDKHDAKDIGPAWEDQIVKAIGTCDGLVFVATSDSVKSYAASTLQWQRALKYKKPVIPILTLPDLDLPYRLAGRHGISYSEKTDHLCQYLEWLASPTGKLQILKDRYADAQHDLIRNQDPSAKSRILEEIAQLDKDIAEQQKIADNPDAAQKRVQESIERGLERERVPVNLSSATCAIQVCQKFINPPPAMAPSYFQNRHVETKLIADFLKDNSRCLMTISGRGGIGKTALVCRALNALQNGQLPDDLGGFSIGGIVYLSAVGTRKINFPNLFSDLCRLLPPETAQKSESLYREPHASTAAKMSALLAQFPNQNQTPPVVVLMDNFEDAVNTETRQITDAELADAIRTLLTAPPHSLKVMITTRIVPHDLPIIKPERQMTLPLDEGLDSPFAEQILKEMDVSGSIGLKNAPDDLLREAKERTRCYPRALEALYGILAADRNTTLEEVLADAGQLLPENVVEVLVGEAFNRLDTAAQKVMQSLAVYGRPVTPTAADYMLSPYLPGVNAAPILSRLVNMQFVRKEGGKYYLHPVDKAYALARIPKGDLPDVKRGGKEDSGKEPPFARSALSRRGADYFKQARLPRAEWKKLDDLAPQLAEIELRIASEDFDTAADVLTDIDFNYLLLWGHFRLMIDLHERIQGKVMDSFFKRRNVGILGLAYQDIGQIKKAIVCCEQSLSLNREAKDRQGEAVWLCNLGNCYYQLGQIEKAIEYCEQSFKISKKLEEREEESGLLGNLGCCYLDLSQIEKAIECLEQAIIIKREIGHRKGEAIHLRTMGNCYSDLGQIEKNIEYYEQSIQIADEIGFVQIQNEARFDLARAFLFTQDFAQARTTAETARKYDYPTNNHNISALLGIIALRQKDIQTARQSFHDAVSQADQILNQTPQLYDALDAKALALAGLAVCEHPQNKSQEYVESAKAAFRQARVICSAKGVVSRTLKLFDALAAADEKGILAGVREAAAGEK